MYSDLKLNTCLITSSPHINGCHNEVSLTGEEGVPADWPLLRHCLSSRSTIASNNVQIRKGSIICLFWSSMNYYFSTKFCCKSVMMLSEKWMYLRPTIMGTISQKIYWGSPCTTALHQQLINNLYSIQGTIYHKNNSIFWFWSYK